MNCAPGESIRSILVTSTAPDGDGYHINGARMSPTRAPNADSGFPSPGETAVAKAYCNQAGFEIARVAMQMPAAVGWATARNRRSNTACGVAAAG